MKFENYLKSVPIETQEFIKRFVTYMDIGLSHNEEKPYRILLFTLFKMGGYEDLLSKVSFNESSYEYSFREKIRDVVIKNNEEIFNLSNIFYKYQDILNPMGNTDFQASLYPSTIIAKYLTKKYESIGVSASRRDEFVAYDKDYKKDKENECENELLKQNYDLDLLLVLKMAVAIRTKLSHYKELNEEDKDIKSLLFAIDIYYAKYAPDIIKQNYLSLCSSRLIDKSNYSTTFTDIKVQDLYLEAKQLFIDKYGLTPKSTIQDLITLLKDFRKTLSLSVEEVLKNSGYSIDSYFNAIEKGIYEKNGLILSYANRINYGEKMIHDFIYSFDFSSFTLEDMAVGLLCCSIDFKKKYYDKFLKYGFDFYTLKKDVKENNNTITEDGLKKLVEFTQEYSNISKILEFLFNSKYLEKYMSKEDLYKIIKELETGKDYEEYVMDQYLSTIKSFDSSLMREVIKNDTNENSTEKSKLFNLFGASNDFAKNIYGIFKKYGLDFKEIRPIPSRYQNITEEYMKDFTNLMIMFNSINDAVLYALNKGYFSEYFTKETIDKIKMEISTSKSYDTVIIEKYVDSVFTSKELFTKVLNCFSDTNHSEKDVLMTLFSYSNYYKENYDVIFKKYGFDINKLRLPQVKMGNYDESVVIYIADILRKFSGVDDAVLYALNNGCFDEYLDVETQNKIKIELTTGKSYEESLTIQDRLSIMINELEGIRVSKMDLDSMQSLVNFGFVLDKHSSNILNATYQLALKDTVSDSVSLISDKVSLLSGTKKEEEPLSFWQKIVKFFSTEEDEPENMTIESIDDLQEAVSKQISILEEELVGYDMLKKYFLVYLNKLIEHINSAEISLTEAKGRRDKIAVIPSQEINFALLDIDSTVDILEKKILTLKNTKLMTEQKIVEVIGMIKTHFSTIDSLKLARDGIIPFVATEIGINKGLNSQMKGISMSNQLMGLYAAILQQNKSLAESNLLQMKEMKALPIELEGKIESVLQDLPDSDNPSEQIVLKLQ